MQALPYTISNDGSLHIHVGGSAKACHPASKNYDAVMDALREQRWEDVEELLQPEKVINEAGNGTFRVVHGKVMVSDGQGSEFEAPALLGEEILRYRDLGLPYDRLVLFAKNLNLNPSFSSVNQLFGWLKATNLTLTEDGCFIAYKGVKENYTDHHTGKFDNTPGMVVKMRRNQVDEDPNSSCSHGLHVANYAYAHKRYGGGSAKTIAVKVHPKDVVAVPVGEHDKMRVCEYLVLEETFAPPPDSPTYPYATQHHEDDHDDEDECENEYEEDEDEDEDYGY